MPAADVLLQHWEEPEGLGQGQQSVEETSLGHWVPDASNLTAVYSSPAWS